MVKIKDIADKCNLSVATVSKALNGKSDLSRETIDFVLRVAKEMGYIPNASARLLKTNRSYSIGVLFVDTTASGLEHEYFSSILNSIKTAAEDLGFDITFISHNAGKTKLTYYEHAKFRCCDGVIIASVDFKDPEVEALVESDIPTVTIDYDFDNQSSVDSDNIAGLRDIINYLVKNGHKKIAFIHGEMTSVTQKRLSSFYRECEARGLNVPEEYIKEGLYHVPQVSGIATRELLELKDRPTCIIYPDDYSLLGGITEIEKHGLHVPEDISVVGYDGIRLSRLMRPVFTTYVQNTAEIGKAAVSKLVEIIENPKIALPERKIVEGHLQEGNTVKKIN